MIPKSKIKHFCNGCKELDKDNLNCSHFKQKVRHECTGPQHYKIFPCLECLKDNQEHYYT